jgi:fibronectin type 3 domain-containing protein
MKCLEKGGGKFIILSMLFIFPLIFSSALAASVQSNPTNDAYVNHNLPTTNYGSDTYLAVRSDATSKARNTFLKFTVSGVSGTVTAAKLKMYSQNVTQSVYAKAVSDTSWTEGAITWNNQPTIGSTLDTKTPSASSWVEFDVASHVTGNGTYSICLQGSIDSGQSFDSKEGTNKPVLEVTYDVNDTTPPAAPTGLGATPGDTQVSLDWNDNTEGDLSHYNVSRSTTQGGPHTEIASNVTVSDYNDTGLTNDTTYYYVVTAVDTNDNESSDSSEVSATPTAGGGGTLEFNPTDDAYVNHNSPTTNYGSDNYLAVRSDATSKARNSFLKFTVSGVSGTVTAAKLKLYSQNVTQSVTAKVSGTSWTEGAITWNNQPTPGSTLDTKAPSASSWVEFDVVSHVTGNGTYAFCLQGSIDSGQSFTSKEGTNKPVLVVTYGEGDTTPPAAPTGLGATPGDTQVSLDWNDNTEGDLSHYNVSRSTTQGGPHTEIATDVTTSAYTNTGLTNNTTYYYVVTAVDTNDNESSDSSEVSATPQDTTAPAAPTGLGATPGDTQVSLDWNDNTEGDLASYSVYRDTSTGGPYSLVASGITTSAYTNTGLTNDTTYYYVVTAVDDSDNESSDSSEVSATPTAGGGGSVESNPTDDSYVNQSNPTANFGTYATLKRN